MNVCTDSFIQYPDQRQWNHEVPACSQQRSSQRCHRLTQNLVPVAKQSWFKHTEKGVLTPNFAGLWSSTKADSFWSEPAEEHFFIPKSSECNTAHLTQNRLNWQPPGTSSLWNTGRVLGKAAHLSLPYPPPLAAVKIHSLVQISRIHPKTTALSNPHWLLFHRDHLQTMEIIDGKAWKWFFWDPQKSTV